MANTPNREHASARASRAFRPLSLIMFVFGVICVGAWLHSYWYVSGVRVPSGGDCVLGASSGKGQVILGRYCSNLHNAAGAIFFFSRPLDEVYAQYAFLGVLGVDPYDSTSWGFRYRSVVSSQAYPVFSGISISFPYWALLGLLLVPLAGEYGLRRMQNAKRRSERRRG